MKQPKLGKEHRYLGHFRGCLREGHNTNEMPEDGNVLTRKVSGGKPSAPKKDDPKPETTKPLPGGVRG